MTTLFDFPQHIYIFASILGLLLLSFVIFSLIPSFAVSRRLSQVIQKLASLEGKPDENLAQIFAHDGVMEHLWREYADSLHRQGEARWRSTMPAGAVFRPDILVDLPLRTDFFKHLPGLFTGVGIIGTFYGLLIGLKSFVISENTIVVRESLSRLLHGVSEAFLISAAAITLAMIVTFIEKLVVSRLNAKVERMVQLLDGLFEGGAEEEYLARLVQASERSGISTDELRKMLAELGDRQISATNAASIMLANRITSSIEEGLKAPLLEIAESLKRDDTQLITGLAPLFEELGRELKALLNHQTEQMSSLQKQTADALQTMVQRIEVMASESAEAGRQSRELMAGMVRSGVDAEQRQSLMQEKLSEFISQMRDAASQTQADAQSQLHGALDELSSRLGELIEGLGVQVNSVTDVSRQHQQDMEAQSLNMMTRFGGQIDALVDGVGEAVAKMQSAVHAMHDSTAGAMSALGNSADTLYLASQNFTRAGELVGETMKKSEAVAGELLAAAGVVSQATDGLSSLFGDYQSSRDAMLEQMEALQLLAEQVRRDASMSGEVLERIEAATGRLVAAQKDTDVYLSKISEVIGTAHQSFSEGMTRVVGEANREFHQALSDSVKLLREGIQELESTLDAVTGI